MMTEDTLRQVLTHVLAAATGTCTLAFQGGEPTLAGLSFFQKVIEFEKELNVNHCRIEHALQTNGLLIDDAWAEFLAENHFWSVFLWMDPKNCTTKTGSIPMEKAHGAGSCMRFKF